MRRRLDIAIGNSAMLAVGWCVALALAGSGLAWGIAIAVVATAQLFVAVALNHRYDRWDMRSLIVGGVYPLLFWMMAACAALHSQVTALIRGPRKDRVVWDIQREATAELPAAEAELPPAPPIPPAAP